MGSNGAQALTGFAERMVTADYRGAAEQFCTLMKAGYELRDVVRAGMDATAPYLNVPSHVMVQPDGEIRGVNYDHCILAVRASLKLMRHMRRKERLLPMAQAVWYFPQGLDIWDQLLCEFPGHYARDQNKCGDKFPSSDGRNRYDGPSWHEPEAYFTCDPSPLTEGKPKARLGELLPAIIDGDRERAYRLGWGLAQEKPLRSQLRNLILTAGILDIQDTIIRRRLQNIGHKALRALALVDIAGEVGFENAQGAFYCVLPDLACNPRFHELFDVTTSLMRERFKETALKLKAENTAKLSEEELDRTIDLVINAEPSAVTEHITSLLAGGKALLAIMDAIVVAYQRWLLDEVEHPNAFFTPGHAMDYCNVVNTWLRGYESPQQPKALYFAALFVNDVVRANRMFPKPDGKPKPAEFREWAESLSRGEQLEGLYEQIAQLEMPRAVALADAYLRATGERKEFIATVAGAVNRFQNDPHIQRNCISSIDEWYANGTTRRDDILRGWVKYASGCVKRSLDTGCWETFQRHFGG